MTIMNLRDTFSKNLKFHRQNSKLSQQALAERCNIATNYLSEIETGKKFPSVEMIERIAAELDIPAHLLFIDSMARQEFRESPDSAQLERRRNNEFSSELLRSVGKILREYGFM